MAKKKAKAARSNRSRKSKSNGGGGTRRRKPAANGDGGDGDGKSSQPEQQSDADSAPDAPKLTRKQTFTIETRRRSELNLAGYNPRHLDPSARRRLKHSIQKYGLVEPPVWNLRSGRLVGGHQRLQILDELTAADDYQLDVAVVDLDDEREKALNLALNNPQAQGQYDLDLLGDVIGELVAADFPLEDTGFSVSDLHLMLGDDFLEGEFADQHDAEAPIVNELAEIREQGKAAEDAEKAAAAGGGPNDGDGLSPDADAGAGDGNQQMHPEQVANPDGPAPAPDGSGTDETMPEEFNRLRKRYTDRYEPTEGDAQYMLVLVFPTGDQAGDFCRKLKLPAKRYQDGLEVAAAAGVEMDEPKAA